MNPKQIQALYSYLMLEVAPVSHQPPETKLPFPFYRPMMGIWNAFFLDEGRPVGAIGVTGDTLERGRPLVETLGHCSACHTPRGQLMQQNASRHLAGAMLDGWWAPNITPDRSGIGDWSDERLSTFLMTGHTDVAIAAGEMGKVVCHSLSKLSREDIGAISAYLRAVPAVASGEEPRSANAEPAALHVGLFEPVGSADWQSMLGYGTMQGDILYQSACASCHGVDGKGSSDLMHPLLMRISAVTGPKSATLVQVIAHGVDRAVGDKHILMPAFLDSLDNRQIASLATYVRTTFGGIEGSVDAQQVATIMDGRIGTPWLVLNAKWIAIVAIAVAALVILFTSWAGIRTLGGRRA